MRHVVVCTIALLTVFSGFSCLAQPEAAKPAFEAASVRLADPASSGSVPSLETSPGKLTIRYTLLLNCIAHAYQFLRPAQIVGPDWLSDIRLDIVARASTPVGDPELFLMLRTLLEERMGVRAHFEKRETPVFVLTLAKGGPKFTESTAEAPGRVVEKGAVVMQGLSMDEFAALFSKMLGRPIVDATGLKGRYDFRFDSASLKAEGQQDEMGGVDLMMNAMRDQMGLKIENRKEAVDFLVIDHAEKTPTEN